MQGIEGTGLGAFIFESQKNQMFPSGHEGQPQSRGPTFRVIPGNPRGFILLVLDDHLAGDEITGRVRFDPVFSAFRSRSNGYNWNFETAFTQAV